MLLVIRESDKLYVLYMYVYVSTNMCVCVCIHCLCKLIHPVEGGLGCHP